MKKKICSSWVLLFIFMLCLLVFSCRPCPCTKPVLEKTVVILTDSAGKEAKEFSALDSVFASFSGLTASTNYDLRILRSDGKEISCSSLCTDKNGIIPTVALWWDIGVEYGRSRQGKLDLKNLYNYSYACKIVHKDRIITEIPIRLRTVDASGPIIYSSTGNGDPLNGFIRGQEGVFLSGLNFPAGSKVQIHLVRDRSAWDNGECFECISEKTEIVQLAKTQTVFTIPIWAADKCKIGSYDIGLEYETPNGVFDGSDLIDTIYGVGFTVFDLESEGNHIETDLACQAPPHDAMTGTVYGAPNPIYKDLFSPKEEVWVAVNPYAGGGNYVGQTARLYVVNQKMEADWLDGAALTDVSTDSYQTVTIQPGCANVNYTKVWSNPTIRDEGYDVLVDFAPFAVYNKGVDIIDKLDAKGFVVPTLWVCLESVTLNHDTNSTAADALNIRKNWTEEVVIPEWQKGNKSYPAAYIAGHTITVKAVFTAASGVSSAKISAANISGSLAGLNQQTVNFSGGASTSVTFSVPAAVPNAIATFMQKWRWYCADINGSGSTKVHFGDTNNQIYIVLASPQAPWADSGQTKVWTEVLQRSCWWAAGETTLSGAAAKIGQHLFTDTGGSYVYGSAYTGKYMQDFKLTQFLSSIPAIGYVNCYDMGKSEVIFANSLGCGLVYTLSEPFGALNCEHAIGKSWNCNEAFGNHGFGNMAGNIFDACLTVDTDSNPADMSNVSETWMLNEPWAFYRIKVVKNVTDSKPGAPVQYNFGIY